MQQARNLLVQCLLTSLIMHMQQQRQLTREQGMLTGRSIEVTQQLAIVWLLQARFVCGPNGLKNIQEDETEQLTDFICGPNGLKNIQEDEAEQLIDFSCGPHGLKNAQQENCHDLTDLFCGPTGLCLINSDETPFYSLR